MHAQRYDVGLYELSEGMLPPQDYVLLPESESIKFYCALSLHALKIH